MADAPLPNAKPEPAKPTSHVRTFAQDAAAVTGKPLPKTVVNVPAPAVVRTQRAPLPEAKIIPKAPTTAESREAVLARLRAKAPSGMAAPKPVVPVTESIPKTRAELLARLRAKAGPVSYIGASITQPPPEPLPSVPPPGIPVVSKEATIHTYKSDFAEFAGKKNASPLSILSAQQDAQTTAPEVLKSKKRFPVALVVGVLLVLAGIGGVTYAYLATRAPIVESEPYVPSLIFGDEYLRISGEGRTLQEALASLVLRDLADGEIAIAYVTYGTTTPEGDRIEEPATGGALIRALGLTAPDILLRNAEAASTVGVIRTGAEVRTFFLLRVASYERTFAGLLAWEATMQKDLALFYPLFPATVVPTASTTEPAAPSFSPVGTFVDETIANHDARVLRDQEGRMVLLYGYKDKSTLIIARNEAAFVELLERLSATRAQ